MIKSYLDIYYNLLYLLYMYKYINIQLTIFTGNSNYYVHILYNLLFYCIITPKAQWYTEIKCLFEQIKTKWYILLKIIDLWNLLLR